MKQQAVFNGPLKPWVLRRKLVLTGDGASGSSQETSGQGAARNGQVASRRAQAAGSSAWAAASSGQGAGNCRGSAVAGAGASADSGPELDMEVDILTVDSPVRTRAKVSAEVSLAHVAPIEADGGCEQLGPFSPRNTGGSRELACSSAQAPGISSNASRSSGKEPAAAGAESEYELAMDMDIMTVISPVKTGLRSGPLVTKSLPGSAFSF